MLVVFILPANRQCLFDLNFIVIPAKAGIHRIDCFQILEIC